MKKKKTVKTERLGGFKNQTRMLKKFEKLMKPIITHRDGGRCQIEGYRHDCNTPLVVDHRPFKRGKHSTFLDPRNLTTVCSNANMLAELDPLISRIIIEVVKNREGANVIKELEILSKKTKKWSHDECLRWILECHNHFQKNKNGKPEISQ